LKLLCLGSGVRANLSLDQNQIVFIIIVNTKSVVFNSNTNSNEVLV